METACYHESSPSVKNIVKNGSFFQPTNFMVVIDSSKGQFLVIILTFVNPFVWCKYSTICMVSLHLYSILVSHSFKWIVFQWSLPRMMSSGGKKYRYRELVYKYSGITLEICCKSVYNMCDQFGSWEEKLFNWHYLYMSVW